MFLDVDLFLFYEKGSIDFVVVCSRAKMTVKGKHEQLETWSYLQDESASVEYKVKWLFRPLL